MSNHFDKIKACHFRQAFVSRYEWIRTAVAHPLAVWLHQNRARVADQRQALRVRQAQRVPEACRWRQVRPEDHRRQEPRERQVQRQAASHWRQAQRAGRLRRAPQADRWRWEQWASRRHQAPQADRWHQEQPVDRQHWGQPADHWHQARWEGLLHRGCWASRWHRCRAWAQQGRERVRRAPREPEPSWPQVPRRWPPLEQRRHR